MIVQELKEEITELKESLSTQMPLQVVSKEVAAPNSVQCSCAAVAANGGDSVMEGKVLGASASLTQPLFQL